MNIGHNLFVSAYHGFYTLGDEHVPTPLPFVPFPGFSMEIIGAEHIGSGQMALRVRMTIYGSNTPMRYALLGKIQFSKLGYSYRRTDYATAWHGDRCDIHLRRTLQESDSGTGFLRGRT